MSGVLEKIDEGLNEETGPKVPEVKSFHEFLTDHAKVKVGGGRYVPYSFEGRPVIEHIVDRIDGIMGSHTGEPVADASLAICGGAQWGKTILSLNFGAYATACRFLNWGNYLPDGDLVDGVVDSKLRPDVLEQIDWLPELMEIGKGENKNKKVVKRKGAFMVTDGERKAFGLFHGMNKVPTAFSADVVMEDEKDDIDEKNSKYLTGRMSGSDLRFRISIGTQRYHKKGQNKEFEDGTQEVQMFRVPGEDRLVNIEENWPQVCRMQLGGKPSADDPQLTLTGDFRRGEGDDLEIFDYNPRAHFYRADPETGKELDLAKPVYVERRPERARLLKFSIRVSQVAIAGMSLSQPVSRWQAAIKDPDSMQVFKCDVLAMPENTTQAISPEIITRSRTAEDPFDLHLALEPGCASYGGLDTGNNCWFFAREVVDEFRKRAMHAEKIPLSQMVRRAVALYHRLSLSCLFIDAHPHVDQARQITYAIHGLTEDQDWVLLSKEDQKKRVEFQAERDDGLVWDGEKERWENLRAAVVQFTKAEGGGVSHKLGIDEQAGFTKYYPIIQCNRFELINRAVNEFLTPKENVIRSRDGELMEDPIMRMPRREQGSPPIVETLEDHFIVGSAKDEKDQFVDKVENHLLLANGYSALAEMIGGRVFAPRPPIEHEAIERDPYELDPRTQYLV